MTPREGWRNSSLGVFAIRLWYLIAFSDTTQTRFFLSITATLWAVALALPGDSFSRATFTYMAAISGEHGEAKWTAIFAAYAILSVWRVFSSRASKWCGLGVNALGFTLFSTVAFSVMTIPGVPFPAGAAAHCAIALASLWVMIRTQVNSASGWRHE